jgi:prepilin-type N-terminal cleavage/methylation domain-containing protein
MNTSYKKVLRSERGFTIVEVLIAAFITSVLTTAAFQFFTKMSSQAEAQTQLSDAQLICRNTAMEIKKSMRMAGFKLDTHDPYNFDGDTVMIFLEQTNPVDTIKYYLLEFNIGEYNALPNLPSGRHVYKLMRRLNSETPAIYSDYILSFSVDTVTVSDAVIQITAQTAMPDFDLITDNGYRSYSLSERVHMRNVN